MRIGTWWHRTHQGRIYLSSWANGHVSSSELLRHSTARCTLCRVRRHARSHGVSGDARMSHPSGMPCEVWAHTSCHHLLAIQSRLSTDVDIDRRLRCTIACTYVRSRVRRDWRRNERSIKFCRRRWAPVSISRRGLKAGDVCVRAGDVAGDGAGGGGSSKRRLERIKSNKG